MMLVKTLSRKLRRDLDQATRNLLKERSFLQIIPKIIIVRKRAVRGAAFFDAKFASNQMNLKINESFEWVMLQPIAII